MNENEFVSDPTPCDVLYHIRGTVELEGYLIDEINDLRNRLASAEDSRNAWRLVAEELLGVSGKNRMD